ncbi:xanthan lyase [Bacteroides sp. 519]|uniref:golvesin C-terminal-like domain-containing protein n=1 Tax=Bacteroides sp. 519 TaxID=2302937 RepID=UPI0013D60F6A|nr:xanthan lyase [Bacteroides sp. 519]NDV56581.1 xanthan lyase [Bacteroides sp. 519]
MSFITNIRSVAKYESKLLLRSWFFRIFTILAALLLGLFNGMIMFQEDNSIWPLLAIPSNIPYFSMLLLNTGQAVVAIFLASDFLKRDKKLDTSEVFYVHPLSNAEYVFGKIWGNLRAFLILNILIMGLVLIFNIISSRVDVDWSAYIIYFLLISIPTLVFIIGFSIFLMLILKNQALTFVILLGYIALTVFYIGNKFYYLFDYMAYSLPLMKSSIVGFTSYATIFNHRAIYLFAGLAFICFTISLFNRLPNSRRSSIPWIVLGICLIVLSATCGYGHVHSILNAGNNRKMYTEINNTYAHHPRMAVENYVIDVQQTTDEIIAEVQMKAVALTTASEFAFCLNPGMAVQEVTASGTPLQFSRDKQILLADMGKQITKGDTVSLSVKYHGRIDENFCYLDINNEVLEKESRQLLINVDKKYAFQTDDYVLFTPETYWYPRPGVAYSDKYPDWQQVYFSHFNVNIRPLPGLTGITQGKLEEESEEGTFNYATNDRSQSATLIIGRYGQVSALSDSIRFSIYYLEEHDYFSAELDTIRDTIPTILSEVRQQFERNYKLQYPFKRFSIVEVPAQFHSYPRAWTQAQEAMQPEIILFMEKGWTAWDMDIKQRQKDQKRWAKWQNQEIDDYEAKLRTFRDFLYFFFRTEMSYNFSQGSRGQAQLTSEPSPYFVFPQLYNFKYNIFSSEWPVSNRLFELYLQNKSGDQGWERQINGVSNNEKASLLFAEHSFRDLLVDVNQLDIMDNMVGLQGRKLLSQGELNIGVQAFLDSVYSVLNRNVFRNLNFELLLDTLGQISQSNLRPEVDKWNAPIGLPYYTISMPEVIHVNNRGQENFVLKFRIANDSDHDGMINVHIRTGYWWGNTPTPKEQFNLFIPARQTKELVSIWDQQPGEIHINTLISGNLPATVSTYIRNVRRENRAVHEVEGIFNVESIQNTDRNEIIVDNEDALFSVSEPTVTGLLPKWLDKIEDTSFKYKGVMWKTPIEWTPTTHQGFFGKYVRSAHAVRSGDGSKTATWKVPLPEPGYYEVYAWSFNEELRWQRNDNAEYHFRIQYGNESEDVFLNLRHAGEEWGHLGNYYFDTDTVRIVLSNDFKLRMVNADAVRLVKR